MAGFNHFPLIAEKLHKAQHQIVGETCQDIVDGYQPLAAVATGYMRSSAYIHTSDKNTYGQGGMEPPKNVEPLPDVGAPPNDLTGYAAVAAPYAPFPELGTVHMAPRPAFYPSVANAKVKMDEKLNHIEDYLK